MRFFICLGFAFVFNVGEVFSWGFMAHQQINRMAVFCLPAEVFGFFKYHIDYVSRHAVDPDKRRYAVEGEAACHYIDLDRYGELSKDSIPMRWKDAVSKYAEDSLMAHGIVPWAVQRTFYRLVDAFAQKDASMILRYASDLGHYVGDAHVPLHTTSNYNGQKTGQHGIHGLWESRIPELSISNYDMMPGRCVLIEDPLVAVWDAVYQSHTCLDTVLGFEKNLSAALPEDLKYSYELKGSNAVRVHAANFALAYEKSMAGMVERRLVASIHLTASFWYSAWVLAGQPDLHQLIDWRPSEKEENDAKFEEERWLKRIFNVPEHDH